jgi:hypothetical protein
MAAPTVAPVERTGPCQGYLCTCRAFVPAQSQPDKTYRTCECRHVQQTHSYTEGRPK